MLAHVGLWFFTDLCFIRSSDAAWMAAIFNLNHPAHTVHWHFFTMSVSNVVVIVLMLVVFVLAIALRLPTERRGEELS